jgi:AraC-like DNA-binding protein
MSDLFDTSFGPGSIVRTGARGILRRVRHSGGDASVDSNDECALVLNLTTAHHVKGHINGREFTSFPKLGSITLLPPGCKAAIRISGECCVLQMRIAWVDMLKWLREDFQIDADQIDLSPVSHAEDAELARLVYATALSDGDDIELTVRSVAHHLFSRYQKKAPSCLPVRGGLAPSQLRRVREIVDQNLTGSLRLSAMADAVGLSSSHFAREFSRSTGRTPHQYVVGRRLDRAATLLASVDMRIGDVARCAGFVHASHFARHFRRLTGFAPEKFRNGLFP